MKYYKILKTHIEIGFEKPLYWDRLFIRDKYINHAIKYKIPIKIKMDKKTYIINDVKKWKKTGERMKKYFLIKNKPMVLYGNFLSNLSIDEDLQNLAYGVVSASSALAKMAEADPDKWEALRKMLHK